MSESLYDIVFYGILQPGKDRELVMQNMAKLFNTEPARLKSYFSGERKVIKSKVDELVAEKYRVALENVGLVIKVEQVSQLEEQQDGGETRAQLTPDAAAGADGLSVAEVGANVLENPPAVEPQPIGDISHLSAAEVGADIIENPQPVAPQPIGEISNLSMAEPGADVFEHPPAPPAPPQLDLDALSLAEPGADVFEHPPEKPQPPQVDTSELELDTDNN